MDITKKYKKYKIKPTKETMEDYCAPKDFKLQPQQAFLAEYFSSKDHLNMITKSKLKVKFKIKK